MFHALAASFAGLVPMAEGVAGGLDIGAALTTIMDIFGKAVDIITGNPVLMVFLCAGLIPIGFSIFSAAKSSVS